MIVMQSLKSSFEGLGQILSCILSAAVTTVENGSENFDRLLHNGKSNYISASRLPQHSLIKSLITRITPKSKSIYLLKNSLSNDLRRIARQYNKDSSWVLIYILEFKPQNRPNVCIKVKAFRV